MLFRSSDEPPPNGDTIVVPVGVVVVGGPGGGFFTIAGAAAGAAPVAVAAGASVIAGSSSGDKPDDPDDPNKPPSSVPEAPSSAPPSSAPPPSSSSVAPTSTEAPTSTSSAVPNETPSPHLIYPKDGATDQDKKDFLALIDKDLGQGNYRVTEGRKVLFVAANITTTQRDTLIKNPLVGGAEPDEQYRNNNGASVLIKERDPSGDEVHEKWWTESLDKLGRIRKRAVVKQAGAPTELIMLSQPPGVDLKTLNTYAYDDSAGADITVYSLDSGYYTKNAEYTGMAVKPRWIFAGSQEEKPVENDLNPIGHGTCAGSKINGPKFGVAKQVNLVIVKARTDSSDTIDALDKIVEDVRSRKLQGKAIVNFSRCHASDYNKNTMKQYVNEMIAEDIIVIAASGNDESNEVAQGKAKAADINTWPALMAEEGVPVINVGAVDNTGKNASFSQGGPHVHVMAPGVQIQCAANSYFSGTRKDSGTSYAAPAVAGLAAYILALGEYPELYEFGKVAANMQKLLMDMAYQRSPDGGRVIFNGQGAVCSRPGRSAKFKRQDLSGEACSVVSSTTALPSATPSPPPATTSNPPTATTAPPPPPPPPPAPKELFSLSEQVSAGTSACFPTNAFSATAGTTYGFSFDVSPDMIVSIETGSTDEGYHQSKGPWTGTFLAQSTSSVKICGSGGSGTLAFKITEEPSEAVKAPAGKEVFKLDEKVASGTTSCFPTTGLNIQEGNYGFSYTTSDGIEIQIGDDSSGPKHRRQRINSQSQKPKAMEAEPKPVAAPKENAGLKQGYIRIIITNCVATDETASTLLDQLQALEPLVAKGSSCKTFKGNSEKILIDAATCCEITAAAMGDFETMIQHVLPESSYEIHVRPLGGPRFLPYV
ncbi:Subtilisin-like protease 2 [Colletotrichum sp. SAR 10_65]|nr:Subtilisin-like protease 2 [Colletotrichum sp. SAR 10_65]